MRTIADPLPMLRDEFPTAAAVHPRNQADAIPTQLIRLLHLASTTLPVGAFSYSQGLEWSVEAGAVTNREQAQGWILDTLRWSLCRYEAPLVAAVQAAWHDGDDTLVGELNAGFLATREASELRAETTQMGYSLLRWCDD
ncbi:MAG: urease accessory UreF family protein, partial [Betaproteobacteria bacterium]